MATKRRFPKPKNWHPTNPNKYVGNPKDIVTRSSWETKFMAWCDMNSSVIKWSSETIVVPYWSQADNKERRYFVDFIVQFRTDKGTTETLMIEIKPESQTKPPRRSKSKSPETLLNETHEYMVNQDKWAAAHKYAEKNGMRFVVLTERELGIKT